MIKGVKWGGCGKAMSYLDTLVVPIIENTPHEEDLRDSMRDVSRFQSSYNATLVLTDAYSSFRP